MNFELLAKWEPHLTPVTNIFCFFVVTDQKNPLDFAAAL
jgi:hypothetical protein